MNINEAAEGILKAVLECFQKRYLDRELDDSEFVRCSRALIEGALPFLEANRETGAEPELVRKALYDGCRSWWTAQAAAVQEKDAAGDGEALPEGDDGYLEHYFDYLYQRGTYPD
jgi:hypothetical protein